MFVCVCFVCVCVSVCIHVYVCSKSACVFVSISVCVCVSILVFVVCVCVSVFHVAPCPWKARGPECLPSLASLGRPDGAFSLIIAVFVHSHALVPASVVTGGLPYIPHT